MAEPVLVAVLADNDPQIRRLVRAAVKTQGWQILRAAAMQQDLVQVALHAPNVVILDLGLAEGKSIDLIRDLRKWSDVPIIALSESKQEAGKIKALDSGADDCVTKPFGVGELMARVRAALRRQHPRHGNAVGRRSFGDVVVNFDAHLVTKAQHAIHLTPIEYRLLTALVANAGNVVTNTELLRQVWGPLHVDDNHYLYIYIGHLRQKLEDEPARPRYLLTETAVGYRLRLSSERPKGCFESLERKSHQ